MYMHHIFFRLYKKMKKIWGKENTIPACHTSSLSYAFSVNLYTLLHKYI